MASLLDALWQVESGNRPGVRGPVTKYGQALGKGQTLLGTAREMAQKRGLPWRPDLLTATTPEGEAYQEAVSEAYLNEGMERTGNTRDALRYYHGGPNRRQWGPKTDAYANKVLSLAGGGESQQMPPQIPPTFSASFTPAQMQEESLAPASPTSLTDIISGLPTMNDVKVQKPKAFDKGGTGWVIAGIIADAIAGGFGGKGGFAPTYLAGQEHNRELEAWREKVAQDREERLDTANNTLARQIALEQWKRDNPEKPDPTNAARMLIERGFTPGTPEFQRELGRYMFKPTIINGQPWGYGDDSGETDTGESRSVVRTGVDASGRRVVQYSDGTIDYAD